MLLGMTSTCRPSVVLTARSDAAVQACVQSGKLAAVNSHL